MDLVYWLVIGKLSKLFRDQRKGRGIYKHLVPSVNTTKFDMCYLEQVEYHNYVSFAKSVYEAKLKYTYMYM